MKSTSEFLKVILILTLVGVAEVLLLSCDDEKVDTIPILSTVTVTEVTGTTAVVSGEVVNTGGSEITASGFVYSSANTLPTLQDNFTEASSADGTIINNLSGLTSSTTYHVRAYAINSRGTGYGEVVDFITGNAAPVVTAVSITGTVKANSELTVAYTYNDQENDSESGTEFQWYLSNDVTGTGKTPIAGATSMKYIVKIADESKFITVRVTPKASLGAIVGEPVESAFVGPVGEATEITFLYNGAQVTYAIVVSPITNRRWLDRNLGAPNAANAYNDFANYGDAFQWGRGADGHQLTNRTATSAGTTGVNGTESALATSDAPGHNKFILTSSSPFDWRNPKNDNLWQGINGVNNPCPTGFRVPTIEEWTAENLGMAAAAYTQLKLTLGGHRLGTGAHSNTTAFGYYWSSSISPTTQANASFQRIATSFASQQLDEPRGMAQLCRCIKN